ncbi:hypothetical protein P8452_51396 [Trifolium repens]|nr:hypothetical protein P8452_51396 [Trifolium repens]
MEVASSDIGKKFDMLADVKLDRDSWCFRVIRLWPVYSTTKPGHMNSLEMIFIDAKDVKIRASIPHNLLYIFRHQIFEGSVYKMSNFTVGLESRFNFGLSLTTIGNVCRYGPDHHYLVDVVGLVMRSSSESECICDGKNTKKIVLRIFDNSGNCDCVLFGMYVDEFQNLVDRGGGGLPVIVLQFAKIRFEEGRNSIENYMNVTRIFLNPFIPEIISFKESLAIVGVVSVGPHTKPSIDEDFCIRNPPISIVNLRKKYKEGFYIVGGIVVSLVDPEQWWYPSCVCHAILSSNSRGFYCNDCAKYVTNMIPRFHIKIKFKDGTGEDIFVIFDQEMYNFLGKYCHQLLTVNEVDSSQCYPLELDSLKGRILLLKVEKTNNDSCNLDERPFKVERICNDLSLIDVFDSPFLNDATDSEDDE